MTDMERLRAFVDFVRDSCDNHEMDDEWERLEVFRHGDDRSLSPQGFVRLWDTLFGENAAKQRETSCGKPGDPVTAYCFNIDGDGDAGVRDWPGDRKELFLQDEAGIYVRLRMTPEMLRDINGYTGAHR